MKRKPSQPCTSVFQKLSWCLGGGHLPPRWGYAEESKACPSKWAPALLESFSLRGSWVYQAVMEGRRSAMQVKVNLLVPGQNPASQHWNLLTHLQTRALLPSCASRFDAAYHLFFQSFFPRSFPQTRLLTTFFGAKIIAPNTHFGQQL